jgi:aromatic ring-opening dioxygenase LigB subunit
MKNSFVIFEFDTNVYDEAVVKSMSRELCERLCNLDEECVNKYDGSDLEDLLNEKAIGNYGCYYRVFEND